MVYSTVSYLTGVLCAVSAYLPHPYAFLSIVECLISLIECFLTNFGEPVEGDARVIPSMFIPDMEPLVLQQQTRELSVRV